MLRYVDLYMRASMMCFLADPTCANIGGTSLVLVVHAVNAYFILLP